MAITIDLQRMTNLGTEGWYSGSNHVHMNYGGHLHNTPENLIFMAEAENLNVIGELVANKDNRVFDQQFFAGKPIRSQIENICSFSTKSIDLLSTDIFP